MFTLIVNGEVCAPEPLGKVDLLAAFDRIARIGDITQKEVKQLGVETNIIDAKDCYVVPGFIDPHQHLLGGSGEQGFSTQTPEIDAAEIVSAGITSVVGCLGVDTTMKTMPGLLAKAKALKEEGLNAYIWSGGYHIPPRTITDNIEDDIMFIEEVIGCGEVAISDERSTNPSALELARIVSNAHNGGMLSRKSGLTHFHVGDEDKRLEILRTLINEHQVKPEWLYPTHVMRSEELMLEAVELAKLGAFVDMDMVDGGLRKWLNFYLENGGPIEKLTVSSDASKTSPSNLFNEFRKCVLEDGFTIDRVLPVVTSNTAQALKLALKGTLEPGKAADILVLNKEDLELRHVFSLGRHLFKDGKLNFKERFLKESNRVVHLEGEKA